MRDPETMQMALAAGETGHLVFSSLHTTDAASTVARIADSFPLERQNTVRQELAMALAAVLVQTLMPKIGGGLIPAAELLMVGYGARQHPDPFDRKDALARAGHPDELERCWKHCRITSHGQRRDDGRHQNHLRDDERRSDGGSPSRAGSRHRAREGRRSARAIR